METQMQRMSFRLLAAAALVTALAAPAWARTLEVGPDAEFPSISAALGKARKGDVIEVASGTYPEAATIKKSVTIRGTDTGSGLPVITPKGGAFVFHLTGGGAVLENLAIEGKETPLGSMGIKDMAEKNAGILIDSNGNDVSGVTVRNLHNGLLIFGNNNEIRDSEFSNNAAVGAGVRSGSSNSFTNSTFAGNGVYGLMLGWLNDPALANDMQAWFKVLRTLKNVEKNTVEGNSFTGNGFAGLILAQASFENEVRGNIATGNGGTIPVELKPWSRGAGIYLSCGPIRNVISENDIRGNDNSGITINPGFDNIFRNNRITDNTSIGIGVGASTGNRFEGNTVSGHADYGIIFKRWVMSQLPAANNLLTNNELGRNGVNAYDESGVAFEPPDLPFVNEEARRRTLATRSVANRWDDGARGNHYDDFDEETEGFSDGDGDGVGEAPRPIPGGAAVDRHPLAQAPAGLGMAPGAAATKLAAVEALCAPFGACGASAQSCGP
jgi:parallel beta-helix repeat protein